MQIGIGLPSMIPGTPGNVVIEWARKAETGPFSSLGVLDRLVYQSYEPMIALAACAGATQRIRQMTTVLLAPLRNPALLAKQAASLDALSGWRLTLGLGIGGREDDFEAAGVSTHERGRRFEKLLDMMRRVAAGEPLTGAAGPLGTIGPAPARASGPEILIGGYGPPAVARVARYGDGFISGGTDPATAKQLYTLALQGWQAAGRSGTPRFVTSFYYGLGPNAAERAGAYYRHYYAFLGADVAANHAQHLPTTPEAVRATIERFRDAGADELMAWPCVADLDQVERLGELVA